VDFADKITTVLGTRLTAAKASASGEASWAAASSGSTSSCRLSTQARTSGGEGRKTPLEAFGTASWTKKIAAVEFGQGKKFLESMAAFLAGEFENRHW